MRQLFSRANFTSIQVFLSTVCALKALRTRNYLYGLGMILVLVSHPVANGQQASIASVPVPSTDSNHVSIAKNYGKLRLSFEANQGQVDPQVRFLSRGNGYSLFLTDSAAVLTLNKSDRTNPKSALAPKASKTDVVRMELAGANPALHVAGDEKLTGTANYFIGNDPANWHRSLPTYGKVRYSGVYPGVDLIYYGNQHELEYDFIVAPHSEAKSIKLHFAGANRLKLDSNGDLEVVAKNGQISFHKPVVYQEENGLRLPVEGRFTLLAKNTVGFILGSYNRNQSVVIDPTLGYSTYLGGSTGAIATAIAVDSGGNAYVTGETADADFPVTSGADQPTNGGGAGVPNAFITKLNPTGTALIYSTYLGGSGNSRHNGDVGTAIAVDSTGNVYVTGYAYSSNFPMKNAFQSVNKAASSLLSDPFVAKLNATGTALIYSTYLGGSSNVEGFLQGDRGLGITVDSSGSAYVTGTTYSTDFPITGGAFQTVNKAAVAVGSNTGFVAKLNPSGETLVYSTFLGGSAGVTSSPCCEYVGDGGGGIAVDAAGDAFVVGLTGSSDFPVTSGAFQTTNHGTANEASNAFVTKLNPTGTGLIYSTYLGGSSAKPILNCNFCQNGDGSSSIVIDAAGDAYVAGGTYSTDFPTTEGAFQTVNHAAASGALTGFVSELNPAGSALIYSTYVGGSGALGDVAYGIALDTSGNVYIDGFTSSADFPVTANAFQSTNHAAANGATNAFVTELNPTGTGLVYSTYLGGSGHQISSEYLGDYGYGIALDTTGNAYVTGDAASSNFPISAGAYQITNKAANGAFIAKFNLVSSLTATTTALTSDGNPQNAGVKVTFTAYVTPTAGSGMPTGTVTFSIDGSTGTSVKLDDTGHSSYATSTLTVGAHTVQASYSGDTNYSGSSSTLTETIVGTAAAISVVSGAGQSAIVGTPFALPLVALVKDAGGNPVSGATVSFTGTGLSFSSATTTTGSSGTASTTATPSAAGALTATASTSGVSASAVFTFTGAASTTPTGSGIISTYAGNGTVGYSGDNGPALDAEFRYPYGVAVDSSGNLYIADELNNVIRKVTSSGTMTTYAGSGTAGYSGDGGQARDAKLLNPVGLALDSNGNLYIADSQNNVVRQVSPAGIITTVAGNGTGGFSGDNGPATSAELLDPMGVTVDPSGNLYIADSVNNRIRIVSNGVIKTIAGNGTYGFGGDGGPAAGAELATPSGVALDTEGKLYIADYLNNRIRVVSASGVITTYAGNGTEGYSGDNGPASGAELFYPSSVAVDKGGNLYISDIYNQRIRMVTSQGIIHTVAGNGTAGFSGDGGSATLAELNHPAAVALDSSANIYIADANNQRVRVVGSSTPAVVTPVFSPAGGSYSSAQTVTIMDSTPGVTIYYTTDGTTPTTSSTEYSGAFMVDSSTTIEAIAVAPGYSNSAVATTTYTINIPPAAATPTFLPASGTYPSAQNVTISDATMGAKIYYTTDGSTPSSGSTLYSAPIVVNVTKTINAIAMASGYRGSAVASAAYTINIPSLTVATPTFSPAAGTYTSAQSVMIADSTAGAVIYYTTDGSAPTPSSTKYTGAITVASTETINAIATASGDTNSAVATATYTINLPAPTFTLAASPTSATISSGQSATFTLTVTPQNGFAQVVNFSCAGLPSGDSCSFSPSSITPVGAAITSTMTIAPATSATSLPLWEKTVGGLTLALLFWPMRRRRVWPVLALTILLAVAMVVTACGGSPKSQVYSITVTAAGGSVSQAASITLTTKN